ncbi:S-adenosylmethionine sensor upstream of mTORC1-like [Scylla paramamosain]|uniref:S-adenosylmethionine sensor upstream of mTORC1-like n=1 Tax=Scylla paramamosain TaxID=85552 RepID=UPI003082F914
MRKLEHLGLTLDSPFSCSPPEGKIRVLDVGSCYNPFAVFPEFEVTAFDLYPAHEPHHTPLTSLPASSFEVIIMSLVLEYLPSPVQRRDCCERAWRLLTPGGLLAIVTPDSKHIGANSHIYQLWRVTLASLGFGRFNKL